MQTRAATNPHVRSRRPSDAAGEAVLLALAAPRPPFIQVNRNAAGPVVLELAGRLRVQRRPDGRLVASTLEGNGRWRRAADLEDASLLNPGALTGRAIANAVEAGLAATATEVALAGADRGYVEKRIRADLYPDAGSDRTMRAVRSVLMHDIADHELLRATCLVFGASACIRDYNDMVRAGAQVLARITGEVPNLAPVLAAQVRRLARKAAPAATLGLMGAARAELMHASSFGRFAKRDWKWLSHQSNSTVRGLLAPAATDNVATISNLGVRLFAAAQVTRPPAVMIRLAMPGGALARALQVAGETGDDARLDDLARLVRLATAEWRRRALQGQSLRFMRDDLGYLIDWWIDLARESTELIPHNAGWASLVRRQQRWHQMIILKNPEFLLHWPSAVPAHEAAGYRVVPLTDSLMLAREGIEMRHCVASYARDCAAGHTRIFAFESSASGERATVELRRRASHWFAGQVKGPCNADASPGMRMAAERLASRYAHAHGNHC